MSLSNLKQCHKCVMDGSASEIILDENNICNFCHQAQKAINEIDKREWGAIWHDIVKQKGKYNVIIGLSGGIDSSTALMRIMEKGGIRPLCFSVDNGYNSKIADLNIMKLVEGLKVPFYRYVIDLEKYKDLQVAFLKGGIKNLEVITDHILFAATYEMAVKYGIKYIITGGNVNSESVMPSSWGEDARDLKWIKSIYKKVTGKKLKGLPMISLWKEQYYRLIKGIKFVSVLNYYDYNKEEAKKELAEKFKYEDYGEKHCENVWTWWFQNYYLFTKWNIDKRKAHFSSLINSGQMTRDEAMFLLTANPIYPALGIEQKVMLYPKKSYDDYPNSAFIRKIIIFIYKYAKKFRTF